MGTRKGGLAPALRSPPRLLLLYRARVGGMNVRGMTMDTTHPIDIVSCHAPPAFPVDPAIVDRGHIFAIGRSGYALVDVVFVCLMRDCDAPLTYKTYGVKGGGGVAIPRPPFFSSAPDPSSGHRTPMRIALSSLPVHAQPLYDNMAGHKLSSI